MHPMRPSDVDHYGPVKCVRATIASDRRAGARARRHLEQGEALLAALDSPNPPDRATVIAYVCH